MSQGVECYSCLPKTAWPPTYIIGSDPNSDILLPARAPARLGTFEFDGNNVTLNVEHNTPVEVNGTPTKSALLDADQEDVPSFITFEDIRMVVVRQVGS